MRWVRVCASALVIAHCTRAAGAAHLEFFKAMEAEHCSRTSCEEEFETLNYRIRSTPSKEWRVVVEGISTGCNTDMRCACAVPTCGQPSRALADVSRGAGRGCRELLSPKPVS